MSAIAFDGFIVVLKPARWQHIILRHQRALEGEPTSDNKAIVHYDKNGKIVAVEITDLTAF